MTTESAHEASVEERLVLEVLQHLVAHKKYPGTEELKGRSPERGAALDALVKKGFLRRVRLRKGARVELTPAGLLKYGSGEAKIQVERFMRLLPALTTASQRDLGKEWSAEELGALAGMPPSEVSLALTLFAPALLFADTLSVQGESRDWADGLIFGRSFKPEEVIKRIFQLGEEEGIGSVARMSHLEVSGYRALDRFSAQLGPLVVIIGANASGKSSLFDLLAFVSFAAANPLPPEIDPRSFGRTLFHSGGPEIIELGLRVDRGEFHPLKYTVEISGPVGKPQVTSERLVSVRSDSKEESEVVTFLDFESGEGRISGVEQVRNYPYQGEPWKIPSNELALRRALNPTLITLGEFREYVVNWKFYSGFDVRNDAGIRRPVLTEPEPILKEDGSNLGAVLFHLMTEHRERWEELETHLRSAIPAFQSLNVKSKGGPGTVMAVWREAGVAGELTLADLSEGTLKFLCWATLFLSPRKPPLLCIDEPELGLHPRVLPVLAGLLRQAATESQLLVATHSPYFLSQFSLDEIAVMKKVEGRAVFARPADNEALRREIEELGTGELVRLHLSDELEARS